MNPASSPGCSTDKATKFGFKIGDTVQWKSFDSDIPKGTLGKVVAFKDGECPVRVGFPAESPTQYWNFPPDKLFVKANDPALTENRAVPKAKPKPKSQPKVPDWCNGDRGLHRSWLAAKKAIESSQSKEEVYKKLENFTKFPQAAQKAKDDMEAKIAKLPEQIADLKTTMNARFDASTNAMDAGFSAQMNAIQGLTRQVESAVENLKMGAIMDQPTYARNGPLPIMYQPTDAKNDRTQLAIKDQPTDAKNDQTPLVVTDPPTDAKNDQTTLATMDQPTDAKNDQTTLATMDRPTDAKNDQTTLATMDQPTDAKNDQTTFSPSAGSGATALELEEERARLQLRLKRKREEEKKLQRERQEEMRKNAKRKAEIEEARRQL